MNRVLKIAGAKTIVFLSILLFLISVIVYRIQVPTNTPYLFAARWSLEELKQYFVGELPQSAVDIQYQPLANYALLSFKASPPEALAFAERFCYGSLLTGYDPFNSIDSKENKSGDGYLIQTQSREFYYSHSTTYVNTQFGNRCNDLKRGGLHQIVVYTQNEAQYEVKLEISTTCTNQNAPHLCDGVLVSYMDRGSMKVNTPYVIETRYAEGDSWEISLEPNKEYVLVVKPESAQKQVRYDFQAATVPVLISESDTTYCEACWLDTRGSSEQTFKASFLSPASGLSHVNLFWMSSDYTFEVSVVEKS